MPSWITIIELIELVNNTLKFILLRAKDGLVVRALASHQCSAGSILRSGVICGLALYSAPRGFLLLLRFLRFSGSISLDLC